MYSIRYTVFLREPVPVILVLAVFCGKGTLSIALALICAELALQVQRAKDKMPGADAAEMFNSYWFLLHVFTCFFTCLTLPYLTFSPYLTLPLPLHFPFVVCRVLRSPRRVYAYVCSTCCP